MDLIYPEHNHPHGVENSPPNEYRIWVCDECGHIFADGEIRQDEIVGIWGHYCKSHPFRLGQRCESHLEPYIPDETILTPREYMMNDFKHGDKVRYIPNHADGDVTHPDCQNGVVSSVNDKFVFVKYDCLACTMVTGDEPYTAQATKRENLVKRNSI